MSGAGAPDPNELTVTVGGVRYGGWEDARVTRGVERMPSDFDVALTEKYPGQIQDVVIKPGLPCVVRLGADPVVTGYIDSYTPSIGPAEHTVRITGRGRCADLVDGDAGFDQNGSTGGQYGNCSAGAVVAALAQPFGIGVTDTVGDPGRLIPRKNIIFGETVWEIIDRVTRYAARLAIEDTNGDLVLAQVGTVQAASGFQQGVNVQSASATFDMSERFSVYWPTLLGVDTLSQTAAPGAADGFTLTPVYDQGFGILPRFRPKVIVSAEMQQGQQFVALLRAQWEAARRYGRSQKVTLTTDSWRDSAQKLWTPNTLARIDLPALKIAASWVISEVSFKRGRDGTTADITLMPPGAFTIEPILVQQFDWQVGAVPTGGAAAPQADTTRT